MGVAHFLGLRYAIWEHHEPSPEAFETMMDLLTRGLAADERV